MQTATNLLRNDTRDTSKLFPSLLDVTFENETKTNTNCFKFKILTTL